MSRTEDHGWELKGAHGPFTIAEIGGNHEGNFSKAAELCELALSTGVDCVKFQVYTGDTLVSRVESPDRNQHFKRFELQPEEHVRLAEMCIAAGRHYTASVWDLSMLDTLDPYLSFYKIGSGDMTAYPLLREFARRGKPLVISTGLSTLSEVSATVGMIRESNPVYEGSAKLALLQCTAMYPIPEDEANLSTMLTMKQAFDVSIGYSDHTLSHKALRVATAMGAAVLEFHFTDDSGKTTFRDHQISLCKADVDQLVDDLDAIRTLLGDGDKKPLASELDSGHVVSFRRAVYPSRDLPEGWKLLPTDLVCLRPNHGIDARDYDRVIGKILRRPVNAFGPLSWEDLA